MTRRLPFILPVLALAVTACADASRSDPAPTPPRSPSAPEAAMATIAPSPPPTSGATIDHAALGVDYILPGPAVVHHGTFHLWAVAWVADAARVVHLTSADGRAWEGDADAPALDRGALGLPEPGPIPSSIVSEPDGTWTMYGGGRLPGDRPVVWRATARDPDGPWTFHPEPVLEPSSDRWSNVLVDHPSVVRTAGGYLMAHGGAGVGDPNRGRIGFAISSDGITWQPVSTTMPGADDERAMGPSACGIRARSMFEPELVATGAGYRLYFGAMLEDGDEMVIGLATSPDGRSWTCAVDGPLPAVDAGSDIHAFAAFRAGGEDRLLVEILGRDSAWSDLWLVGARD